MNIGAPSRTYTHKICIGSDGIMRVATGLSGRASVVSPTGAVRETDKHIFMDSPSTTNRKLSLFTDSPVTVPRTLSRHSHTKTRESSDRIGEYMGVSDVGAGISLLGATRGKIPEESALSGGHDERFGFPSARRKL